MSEWNNSKKKPSVNFRKFLKERLDKDSLHPKELTNEERTKLEKLEVMPLELKRGENVLSEFDKH